MIELASEYIRTHWRDTLDRVFRGEVVAVVRYGKEVAVMVQPEEWERLNRVTRSYDAGATLKGVIASLPKERQDRIEKMSSKLFDDLGLTNADDLGQHGAVGCWIVTEISERGMAHGEVAALLGIEQDKVEHLMNGHFDSFTTDDLIDFLVRL